MSVTESLPSSHGVHTGACSGNPIATARIHTSQSIPHGTFTLPGGVPHISLIPELTLQHPVKAGALFHEGKAGGTPTLHPLSLG